MKRFIRYLYEYERGRRLRNVGFVKVEQNGNECTLHIHGKGLHMKGERKLTVYLFFQAGDECVGTWQGTIDNVNPAINYRLHYNDEDVGGSEHFQRINGIILESEMGHKYAAVWDDTVVDIGNMRVLNLSQERGIPQEKSGEQPNPERKEEQQERPDPRRKKESWESREFMREETEGNLDSAVQREPRESLDSAVQRERQESLNSAVQGERQESLDSTMERERQESLNSTMERERQESLDSTMRRKLQESPESVASGESQESLESVASGKSQENREPVQEEEPREGLGLAEEDESDTEQEAAGTGENPQKAEAISQETCSQDDEQNIAPQSSCQCTKIRRNDIARLPRCEWKWANNSFLLHGYYNYHHLALIHEGNRFLLGVPGIYHPQEAKAAGVFGFTEFIPAQDMEIDLTDDERDGQDKFGYWCRPVKKPLKM